MSDILKVMIVEDEQLSALDLKEKLEKMGFTVTGVFDTGEQALSAAAETHPDLVLMDIVLAGDMDGIETAKLLRENFDIPAVYLTALTDEQTIERAKLSDPFAYLIKPFNERELKFIIETTIYKHKMERELKENEEKYRVLFDNAGTPITYCALDGTILLINPIGAGNLGGTPENLVGKSIYELLPGIADKTKERVRQIVESGTGCDYYSDLVKLPSGGRWFSSNFQPVRNASGGIFAIQVISQDITERKQVEEAVRESEERYRTLQANIPVGVFRSTLEGKILSVNPAMVKMFGCDSEEELQALPTVDLYCVPLHREELIGLLIDKGEAANFEVRMKRKDGSAFWATLNIRALTDEQGKIVHYDGILEDITERRKTGEELLRAEKLESVGVLAGGIAHDFNNIMAAILVNVGLAKLYVKKEDKVLEKLNETENAILRAKDLTQQLLTFSKGGAPVMSPASIDRLLSNTLDFALSGKNVTCDCTIPDDLWNVEIDKGQVSQVIRNLIINAAQAMSEGGVVRIGAENVTIEAGNGLPLNEGRYIRISINDRGIGIPRDHLDKIFDPFFSTKHKGSGLGLSTAYSIIKNHNGLITVDSDPGKGSAFYIYLPASSEKKVEKEKPLPEIAEGDGKILVMDDEDIVLKSTGELLQKIGFTVETAIDGFETIELYKEAMQANHPFDLVILDLIVPGGLGGQETIRRLLEIDPKIKAVVSSGYSTNPVIAKHKEYGFAGALTKPYRIKELSAMLQKVMAGSAK